MQGRFHYYEGYTMHEVAFPIRIMKFLGIRLLILSNASGGVNPDFNVGDLMIIEDHINLMKDNPLIGPNEEELGTRFPDMGHAYDPLLIRKAFEIAERDHIKLQKRHLCCCFRAGLRNPCRIWLHQNDRGRCSGHVDGS